ncbi:MAG: hypothetical protein MST10_06000 [Lentisphaeria bacterium]|nr:hypothetical protein [Lentisphaeria bacterium]
MKEPVRQPCTVVTAGDQNYVWGVFLLLSSMQRWQMSEPVIVGAYSWDERWLNFIGAMPNVKIIRLDRNDRRCVCVTKPMLMLQAETEFVTWIDSDGIFSGNCSDLLYGEPECLYARSYNPLELTAHHFARLPATIATWIRDVGDLPERRDINDVCTNVVGLSLSYNRALLEKWRDQMHKVLPLDVGIVCKRGTPYFQTDESVLNSLLSCWGAAPEITGCYRLDNLHTAHYIHLAFNPKPWQEMWTQRALCFYDEIMNLLDWCRENDKLPSFAPLPRSLRDDNRKFYELIAPFAPTWCRVKKVWRKLKK